MLVYVVASAITLHLHLKLQHEKDIHSAKGKAESDVLTRFGKQSRFWNNCMWTDQTGAGEPDPQTLEVNQLNRSTLVNALDGRLDNLLADSCYNRRKGPLNR